MTVKKNRFKDIPPDQKASFKQQWAVAYRFAKDCNEKFSQKSEKALAVIFNAVIHRHHAEHNSYLSHSDVQGYLDGKNECPNYYIDLIAVDSDDQELAEQVSDRDIKSVTSRSHLLFSKCIKDLSLDHAKKLQWLSDHKGELKSWKDLAPEYINSYKGIFKPMGMDFALSVRTQKRSKYKDGEFEYYPNNSWVLEYDLELNEQSENGSASWANQALLNSANALVPIAVIEQVKTKPNPIYQLHGLGLVKPISDTRVRIYGFNDDGMILKTLYEM